MVCTERLQRSVELQDEVCVKAPGHQKQCLSTKRKEVNNLVCMSFVLLSRCLFLGPDPTQRRTRQRSRGLLPMVNSKGRLRPIRYPLSCLRYIFKHIDFRSEVYKRVVSTDTQVFIRVRQKIWKRVSEESTHLSFVKIAKRNEVTLL